MENVEGVSSVWAAVLSRTALAWSACCVTALRRLYQTVTNETPNHIAEARGKYCLRIGSSSIVSSLQLANDGRASGVVTGENQKVIKCSTCSQDVQYCSMTDCDQVGSIHAGLRKVLWRTGAVSCCIYFKSRGTTGRNSWCCEVLVILGSKPVPCVTSASLWEIRNMVDGGRALSKPFKGPLLKI